MVNLVINSTNLIGQQKAISEPQKGNLQGKNVINIDPSYLQKKNFSAGGMPDQNDWKKCSKFLDEAGEGFKGLVKAITFLAKAVFFLLASIVILSMGGLTMPLEALSAAAASVTPAGIVAGLVIGVAATALILKATNQGK